MPLRGNVLRPTASGATHPDAADWARRVINNGGTVGSSTLSAVSKFCAAVNAANIRDRFLRLNLFCGKTLEACLVPLYLASSRTAAQIGNTTDTNNGPFVSGDFQETGSGGGLKGDGTTKYLNTGLSPNNINSLLSLHLSSSGTSLETSGDRMFVGSFNGGAGVGPDIYALDIYANYVSGRAARLSNYVSGQFPVITTPGTSESHIIGTRTSATSAVVYRGGSSAATNSTSVSPSSHSRNFFVFALNSSGTANTFSAARLRMYSIGNGLTAEQSLAFSNAVVAFNTTLGRE